MIRQPGVQLRDFDDEEWERVGVTLLRRSAVPIQVQPVLLQKLKLFGHTAFTRKWVEEITDIVVATLYVFMLQVAIAPIALILHQIDE